MENVLRRSERIAMRLNESNTNSGNWYLPLYTSRPLCSTGDLCVTCEECFTYMLYPPREDFHVREYGEPLSLDVPPVGWLDRVLATKSCALCHFITQMAEIEYTLDLNKFDAQYRVYCTIRGGKIDYTSSARPLRVVGAFFLNFEEVVTETRDGQASFETRFLPETTFALDHSCSTNLRKYDARLARDMTQIFNLGRKVANDISPTFLRTCYETCRLHHVSKCQLARHPTWAQSANGSMQVVKPSLRSVRVIDTRTLKLVHLPDGADFVALSYTWSTAPFISLLRSTEEDLFQNIEMHQLPPTFSDAIQVVRWIGERYLWADRLCIMQDSAEDKHIQLAQMDQIYLQATLTIVAADSGANGTDKGLPGIRKGTRAVQQATATIRQNVQLTQKRTLALDAMISGSQWSTRAWTYQEKQMSKRQLIFLQQQVVFLCQQDTFTEDYVYRSCLHGTGKQAKARGQNDERLSCCHYQTPTSPRVDCFAPTMHSDPAYCHMVYDYTARQLTVLTDALDAINGFLRIITTATGQGFLCGLPITFLVTEWLTWRPLGYSKRRHRVALKTEASDNYSSFLPSWSWAGWIGPATYHNMNYDFPWKNQRVRRYEPMVEAEYTVLLPEIQESRKGKSLPFIDLRPEETDENLLSRTHPHINRSSLQLSRLHFSAPTATVHLAPTLWGCSDNLELPAPADITSYAHQVFIDSSFAGIVHTHIPPTISASELLSQTRDFRECLRSQHSEFGRLRQVELIALSETPTVWPILYPYSPDDAQAWRNQFYMDAEGEKQYHVPFDPEVWKVAHKGGILVNVLMIEWDDIGGCMVARRTGVGQVHCDAWDMLEPEVKEIILG